MDQSRDENDIHRIQELDGNNNHDGSEDETQELKSNSKYDKRLLIKLAILSLASFPPEVLYKFYSVFAVPLQLKLGIPIGLTLIPMIIATVIGLFLSPIIDMACCFILFVPTRAFVIEAAPNDMQVIANSLITCSAGIGTITVTVISGIDWRETPLAKVFGGQVEVVFILIATISIVVMLIATISYTELPYAIIDSTEALTYKLSSRKSSNDLKISTMDSKTSDSIQSSVKQNDQMATINVSTEDKPQALTAEEISSWNHLYQTYYFAKTMPKELFILWMISFFSSSSYIGFTSFLTDFVGQSIYHGNPLAAENSTALHRYNRGVSVGSWGLLGCTILSIVYSLALERITKYIDRILAIGFSIGGIGALVIGLTNQVIVVLCMVALQGIGFSSGYTLIFSILASYHHYFAKIKDNRWNFRELGLDVSLFFVGINLACIITGCSLGVIVSLVHSSRAAMIFSGVLNEICAVMSLFIFRVPNDV
ncbi:uncharacterized protein TRIADDRAFT_53856 [Trichoplax adhaerens]|uniref:Uncharacterized protein n=1 Tax=Trichoplax adhaerens TaxID=10228 RepID=B3RQC5_TRIAD|nr:hypothetical protein TRIADDRAFT_53856 [Trichoplax adhaerens]EDV27808.1 hypothetical protein TRIADDRAFT_53856 [Trichoplax adhaerens]|eukprot:XP_002109642.1 hypothetical protein TRIADDRAFT_53856 [Trichoplax adhaerens]